MVANNKKKNYECKILKIKRMEILEQCPWQLIEEYKTVLVVVSETSPCPNIFSMFWVNFKSSKITFKLKKKK